MNQRASVRAPVVAVGVLELILWVLRQRIRFRVDGHSMEPALQDGVYVLVRKAQRADVGSVVLCRHPFKRDVQLIKRVDAATDSGMFLVGDNPETSTDSNSFGVVPWVHLVGVVTAQMR